MYDSVLPSIYEVLMVRVVPYVLNIGGGLILYLFAEPFCKKRFRLPCYPLVAVALWLFAAHFTLRISVLPHSLVHPFSLLLHTVFVLVVLFDIRLDTLVFLSVMFTFLDGIYKPILSLIPESTGPARLVARILSSMDVSIDTLFFFSSLTSILTLVVLELSRLLLEYLGAVLIKRGVADKSYRLNGRELLFLLTPATTCIIANAFTEVLGSLTLSTDTPSLSDVYDRFPMLSILEYLLLLLLSVIAIADVYVFYDLLALHKNEMRQMLLRQRADEMKERLSEMTRSDEQIRRLRHDMKNHLAVLAGLSASVDGSEELKAYLGKLQADIAKSDSECTTGNVTIDALLTAKSRELSERLPDCRLDTDELLIPPLANISDYDLAIVLGNALDNAIEACEKLAAASPSADCFITATARMNGNTLLFTIENSCVAQAEGEGSFHTKANGRRSDAVTFPPTDKSNKNEHGFGFLNMKSVVDKYHGAMDWSVANEVFTLSVMLLNSQG